MPFTPWILRGGKLRKYELFEDQTPTSSRISGTTFDIAALGEYSSSVAGQWGRRSEKARFFDEISSGNLVINRSLGDVDRNKAFEEIFDRPTNGCTCFNLTQDLGDP